MVFIELAQQCGGALIRHAGIRASTLAGVTIAKTQPIRRYIQPSGQRA